MNKEITNKNHSTYVVAEIGNNHQGSLENALKMVRIAKEYCGVSAVKFQKRDNDSLFTEAFARMPYTGRNSFGVTYGEHRKALELSKSLRKESKVVQTKKQYGDFSLTALSFASISIFSG